MPGVDLRARDCDGHVVELRGKLYLAGAVGVAAVLAAPRQRVLPFVAGSPMGGTWRTALLPPAAAQTPAGLTSPTP